MSSLYIHDWDEYRVKMISLRTMEESNMFIYSLHSSMELLATSSNLRPGLRSGQAAVSPLPGSSPHRRKFNYVCTN